MENFFSPNDPTNQTALNAPLPKSRKIGIYWRGLAGAGLLLTIFSLFFFGAPKDFPSDSIFRIEKGDNLREVSLRLKNNNMIQSRIAFEFFVILYGGEKHIITADYSFKNKPWVFEIARRISKGDRQISPIKVTIPEGYTVFDIAKVFESKLPDFDEDKFLAEARVREGYLFPDTYFFFSNDTEKEVLESMSENFEKKMLSIRSDLDNFTKKTGKTEKEIIVMASLIEGEAKGDSDRSIISGILWKRISMGIPLQVDVALDTYKTKGLPENPISNPGLKAIKAALYPETSPYLYYIHDKAGNTYYAKSFAEHRKNIAKYLK